MPDAEDDHTYGQAVREDLPCLAALKPTAVPDYLYDGRRGCVLRIFLGLKWLLLII